MVILLNYLKTFPKSSVYRTEQEIGEREWVEGLRTQKLVGFLRQKYFKAWCFWSMRFGKGGELGDFWQGFLDLKKHIPEDTVLFLFNEYHAWVCSFEPCMRKTSPKMKQEPEALIRPMCYWLHGVWSLSPLSWFNVRWSVSFLV